MTTFLYTPMVALALIGLTVVFTGWGLLFRRLFNPGEIASKDVVLAPWIGWCLIIALLQLWHLFLPVNSHALIIAICVGFAGMMINARSLYLWLSGKIGQVLGFAVVLCAISLWLANLTTTQPTIYDSGLYHLNSIRWAGSYPTVPGLANLHGRLGFNSSFFLYAAMLNVGPFLNKCHHLATGSLFLISLVPCLWGLFMVWRNGIRMRIEYVYNALFCVPVLVWVVSSGYASSPSPDAVVFLIGIAVGAELIRLLEMAADDEQSEVRPRTAGYRTLAVLLLSIAGLTVKLSFMGLGAGAAILACVFFFGTPGWRMERTRLLAWSTMAGLLFIVPWMVRGVILSGYVAYPLNIGAIPVDWKVSSAQVYMEAGWAKSWARMPHVDYQQVLADWKWLRPWISMMVRSHRFDVLLPLGMAIAAILLILVRRLRDGVAIPRSYWLFLAVPASGLVFWFFSAPAPRYAGACFWMLAIGTISILPASVPRRSLCTSVLFLSAMLFCFPFFLQTQKNAGPARTVAMKTMMTDSGLQVFVPSGDNDQCWDAPLPCAPHFNPKLRLRDPADMSRGFTFQPEKGSVSDRK